jgi:hypothetical protein
MARFGPKYPPWLTGKEVYQATPLDSPADTSARWECWIACTVSGQSRLFLIPWRAHDVEHAVTTFLEWLNQGWAIMSHTFLGEHCRYGYVFRTSAINGFFVVSD